MGKMAIISQINGNEVVGKEFYEYVRTEGTVLFSFNPDFSPAALYGGSWEKITGRFLIGAGGSYALGSTGGAANVTLTVDEMPSHSHRAVGYNEVSPEGSGDFLALGRRTSASPNVVLQSAIDPTGGNQPHNNMPPYIGCNIWRKIA